MFTSWLVLVVVSLGGPGISPADDAAKPPAPRPALVEDRPGVVYPLTLHEAIRIGLDNADFVRVVREKPAEGDSKTGTIEVARVNADASTWSFKAGLMAHVRAIEQAYWSLSHAQVALWSRETGLRIGEEILKRERGEFDQGRATQADIAEATQQVENFKLALITATSDVITSERELRSVLGMPPADARRIVPATSPTETKVEPDWEACLREMRAEQPDIVQQEVLVRLGELRLLLARNQPIPPLDAAAIDQLNALGNQAEPLSSLLIATAKQPVVAGLNASVIGEPEFIHHQVGLTSPSARPGLGSVRQQQYALLRDRAQLQKILHQTTHTLARYFLEVDANFKQFRTAQRLRGAAQDRLEAQRAFYEEGRITIDRLLDAVSQYANAVAQESQYRTSYNTSIAGLEEAKGTLLAAEGVAIVETPATAPEPQVEPKPPIAEAKPASMTYKLKARVAGLPMIELEFQAEPTTTAKP
jgi:outer membrane protein TolC